MDALVCVHGYLGGSAHWAGQARAFAGRYDVIAPDLPGFGAAAAAPPLADIAGYADFALNDLSARGTEKFHLLGHSMGGMIAQEMAVRAPGRVMRLALYGTGAAGGFPGRFETVERSIKRVNEDGPAAAARRIAAAWFKDGAAAPGYPLCEETALKAGREAMIAGLSAFGTWPGARHLARIKAPVLVLWGDCDRSYPWSETERLRRAIPGARLAVMPGCGHAAHLEKPELFNALLGGFLDEGGGGG